MRFPIFVREFSTSPDCQYIGRVLWRLRASSAKSRNAASGPRAFTLISFSFSYGRRFNRRRACWSRRCSRKLTPSMATMLIGITISAPKAARFTAVSPRSGAGARPFAFGGVNKVASPSRVLGLGRRGAVGFAVRASRGVEPVLEEKSEARFLSADAQASASRAEAFKQVRPFARNIMANLARVRAERKIEVGSPSTDRPPSPTPFFRAVWTSRSARCWCHGPRAGFPLCVPVPVAKPPARVSARVSDGFFSTTPNRRQENRRAFFSYEKTF